MAYFSSAFFLFCLCPLSVFAALIETFYGAVEVEEPVLLELIESPPFQRLKHIHQYGVAYYTTHREEYTRYDHSLGVFYLLRAHGLPLKEQIAGLLHDVSHTIFSHVGEWIFNRQECEVDYQTLTHCEYLQQSGLGEILIRHGYAPEEMQPTQENFPALEKPLPYLCADRIDYNLQGAFYQGYITREEAIRVFHNIEFIDGQWICSDHEVLRKLVRYSIFMSQDCWGSGTEYVLSMWLASAIIRGTQIGLMTIADIRFGFDEEIWHRLLTSEDPLIQENMHKVLNATNFHCLVSENEANLRVKCKFRGIDPLIDIDGERLHLTAADPVLGEEFQFAKEKMAQGWSILLK